MIGAVEVFEVMIDDTLNIEMKAHHESSANRKNSYINMSRENKNTHLYNPGSVYMCYYSYNPCDIVYTVCGETGNLWNIFHWY